MASKYLSVSLPRMRAKIQRTAKYYGILNCIYHEHLLFTGNASIDYIHDARFHYGHYMALKRFARSAQSTRVRNICLFSGSARAVLSMFRMSRFTFKMYARNGRINGVTKSS